MGRRERPRWAVVIPAYNEAERISDALGSLLNQTHPADRIVVVDDGSTDEIEEAVRPFRESIVFVQQENLGISAARNRGASLVAADWITFLDADDLVSKDFLRAVRGVVQDSPDVALVATEAAGVDVSTGAVLYRHYRDRETFPGDGQREAILRRNFLLTGVSVRRDLWLEAGRFDEAFRGCEDWDCWLRMILQGGEARLASEGLLYRRHHGDNLSSNRPVMLEWRIATLEKALTNPELLPDERRVARDSIRVNRRTLAAAASRDRLEALAVRDSRPGLFRERGRALSLAFRRHVRWRRRAFLVAAACFPGRWVTRRV